MDILADKPPTIPRVAQLLRKSIVSFQYNMQLYYRALERDKILYLKKAKGSFSKIMSVSPFGTSDILWWIQNIDIAFSPIRRQKCVLTLQTDTFMPCWGGRGLCFKIKRWFIYYDGIYFTHKCFGTKGYSIWPSK